MSNSTALVPSRGCRHVDWRVFGHAGLECCYSCGMSFKISDDYIGSGTDPYADLQQQPSEGDTFAPAQDAEDPTRFAYMALDQNRAREIRILILYPAETTADDPNEDDRNDDHIRCDLEVVNLQQYPVYEAVSYTWADQNGDDTLSERIICGSQGKLLAVTRNCAAMLRRLRPKPGWQPRRLWVDAICINQSNYHERNHQVGNMVAIFRGAQRVIVYLGTGEPATNRLLEYITTDAGGVLPSPNNILPLYRSRWFHRVWVLQEIAVAKTALVVSGPSELEWTNLVAHAQLIDRLLRQRGEVIPLPPALAFGVHSAKVGNKMAPGLDVLSAMQISRGCSCKDARDKIYAVIGLIEESLRPSIRPDYAPGLSAAWIFLKLAAWHMVETNSLAILEYHEPGSGLKLPSWVPDWTIPTSTPLPSAKRMELVKQPDVRFYGANGNGPFNFHLLPSVVDYLNKPPSSYASPIPILLGRRIATVQKFSSISSTLFNGFAGQWPSVREYGHYSSATFPQFREGTGAWMWRWLPAQSQEFRENPRLDDPDMRRALAFWESFVNPLPKADGLPQFILACRNKGPPGIPQVFGGFCPCGGIRTEPQELNDFMDMYVRYGMDRTLFATEFSIGFGPKDLADHDEIWSIAGLSTPIILRFRRVSYLLDSIPGIAQYSLVGRCYLHAGDRAVDKCGSCLRSKPRYSPDRAREWKEIGLD